MIGNRVRDTLQQVFSHPKAGEAKRSSGEGYATSEAHREVDVFHYLKSSDSDGDGSVKIYHPGHCLAVPSLRTAEYSGCPQSGSIHRVDGLILSTDKNADPAINTFIETQFTPEGIVKREASFGGPDIVARKVSIHHFDPQQNYVEEFRIAR